MRLNELGCVGLAVLVFAHSSWAQSFVDASNQLPTPPYLVAPSLELADVDGDGDADVAVAAGIHNEITGPDQNRLWINRGGEPGGTIGYFVDRTASQFPALSDDTQEFDFVDIDGDGDQDLFVSNVWPGPGGASRWWINMGGAQGGTEGFFQDQTATRWRWLGVNDGVDHHSSLAPSVLLGSGGFIDWCGASALGDLDGDGDPDLVHTSRGGDYPPTVYDLSQVPTRLFLNDGDGHFEEFNPSGHQLSSSAISAGAPALWALGVQRSSTTNSTGLEADIADRVLSVDVGDLDGDFDLDIVRSAHLQIPRIFRNRYSESGYLDSFQDVTTATGILPFVDWHYNVEQELGDFDGDSDLDLLGANWNVGDWVGGDALLANDGSGWFSGHQSLGGLGARSEDVVFLDYDGDGRLDIFPAVYGSYWGRLYRNGGPPTWSFAILPPGELPATTPITLGSAIGDVDLDGDPDLLTSGQSARMFVNVVDIPDTIAPRVANLEQAPHRASGAAPTVIRVHVYDNDSWDATRFGAASLEYSTNAFDSFSAVAMRFAGGQVFRGAIPGSVIGAVSYRVRFTDAHGNVGVSVVKTYNSTGPGPVTYCTTSTTTSGCNPAMGSSGTPSIAAPSGFTLTCSNLEGQRAGLFFYGVSGRVAAPWAPGNTSTLCVKAPVQRLSTQNSGGTAGSCNGAMSEDWLAYQASHPGALGQPYSAGATVNAQTWFRDPSAPATTNLSNGLEFVTVP